MPLHLQLAAMLLIGSTSAAAVAQGWIVDLNWRYEVQAGKTLSGGSTGPGGADTRISANGEVKIVAEARGTMEFAGKLSGAAAVNMPDGRNQQRYDSWRFSGRKPAFASVDIVAQLDEASRLNVADGEGSDMINARRKGLVGRVQHQRQRFEVKASGDNAGWFGDHSDLQIDRVTNKLMIVNGINLQLNREVVKPTWSYVTRMDKPAAAGEWDRSRPDDNAWRTLPHVMPLGVIEFDIPTDADQFTLTRTYEVSQLPDPFESLSSFPSEFRDAAKVRDKYHRGRATLTLNVRRRVAAAAAPAPAAAEAPATQAAPATTTAQPAPAKKSEPTTPVQPSAAEEAVDTVRKLRGLFGR